MTARFQVMSSQFDPQAGNYSYVLSGIGKLAGTTIVLTSESDREMVIGEVYEVHLVRETPIV